LVEKGRRVIYTPTPLEKLGESSTDFRCKFCDHADLCWGKSLPLVSCRTCAFSTPEVDGTWTCGRGEKKVISEFEQKTACEGHVFIPDLVPLLLIGADPEMGTIEYEGGIINGPGFVLSVDLEKEIMKRNKQS
jgi:hypothetical protein